MKGITYNHMLDKLRVPDIHQSPNNHTASIITEGMVLTNPNSTLTMVFKIGVGVCSYLSVYK